MVVRIGESVLAQYRRISLFNSPYVAHRTGRAIDLYPGRDVMVSPVSGRVTRIERFRTPDRPRTVDRDVLIVVDTGERRARMLHVEPAVSVGDEVEVGDPIGRPVRTGYFDPWVPPHTHLEFRPPGVDVRRARGGEPIELDVRPIGLEWDGTGTVREMGPGYAVLDAPAHLNPGERFVGLRADGGGVLDGGITHYGTGGLHGGKAGPVSICGGHIGASGAAPARGIRSIECEESPFLVNGEPITGLSCVLALDGAFGARLIGPPKSIGIGDSVDVSPPVHDKAE